MDEVTFVYWEIDRALPYHAQSLTSIALAAKRYWEYSEQWIESWRGVLTITPDYVGRNEVCAALMEGEPVAFYSLIGEGDRLELDHLWVLPENIGSGIGRSLFDHAIKRAAVLGAKVLEIESDPNAEGFYRRMGAKRTGENTFDIEGQRRSLPLLDVDVRSRIDEI